ncbi:MAG: cytochrome c biogenesis protein [Planctomycetota bacterium]|jgi:ABC-type transport system involved in cytochrome c biogenesis permease subunit
MAIKYSIQGLLIYSAMAGYLLALVLTMLDRKKLGQQFFMLGFGIALISFVYRWYHVRHVPMQNLFEVFLCLGLAVYPLSLFYHRILRVGGRVGDMFIGVIVLFPAGFIFSSEPQHLPPALQCWVFVPHVAVYMLSYILMAKAAMQAVSQLYGRKNVEAGFLDFEEASYHMVCAGFPLLTLGLILGSYWGKLAWGDYWGWDPKELWSLASWLVYIGYFHFRYMYAKKYSRINSIWILTGLVFIIITLLWANLSRIFAGMHSYAV